MQYAISDIHGCYDQYIQLLDRIDLKPSDTLYVLGDMIDRGPDGLKVLRDIARRPNVIPFLGNHELAALTCLPWLLETIDEKNTEPEGLMQRLLSIQGWTADGGDKTIEEFGKLSQGEREEVLELLRDLTVYEEVDAGGNTFVLVHAGLDHFSPERPLDDYRLDELVMARPDLNRPYFPDKYLVFGHTPTPYLYAQETGSRKGKTKIFRKGNLIGIDCACVFGGPLGCLCLDTLEEIY